MAFEDFKRLHKSHFQKFASVSPEFQDVLRKCNRFFEHIKDGSEDSCSSLYCPVALNYASLENVSGLLSNLLLNEPLMFQAILHDFLVTPFSLQKFQIQIPIVVVNFPSLVVNEELNLGFCSMNGTLAELYAKEKYIRSSVWKCSTDGCRFRMSCKKLPSEKLICNICCAALLEDMTFRKYGNLQKARFILKSSKLFDAVVYFYDAQSCNVSFDMGAEYFIVGVKMPNKLRAWGVTKVEKNFTLSDNVEKIQQIRLQCQNDPWMFTGILANVIGRKHLNGNILLHFRLVLLLSLASVKCLKPISIFAISNDDRIVEKIMTQALLYSSKNVRPIRGVGLAANVKSEVTSAGALLLARDGICYLGDWKSHSNSEKKITLKTVECDSLSTNSEKISPSNCVVWTYSQMPYKKNEKEHLLTMYKSFGLIWKVEPAMEEIETIAGSLHVKQGPFEIQDEDIKMYLEFVNTLEVKVLDDAVELLQKYFVCTRLARGEVLPLTGLDPLTSLAEAHARINNRNSVTIDDVLMAIYLCEYSLGPCYTVGPPPPVNIAKLKEWLENHLFRLYTE